MDQLSELKSLLSQLEISSSKIIQYDWEGIEIEIVPSQVIYLNYQAHQIQIDPQITYRLSVPPNSTGVKISREGADPIDLPIKQIKRQWTDLLSTLLSLSQLLVKEEKAKTLLKWRQLLDSQIKAIQNIYAYNIDLDAGEVEVEMEDGTYCFRWDQNGNLHEEGSHSAEWNYNGLEFLDTANQLIGALPTLRVDSDSDSE
jgi:hypothetical protein